MSPSGRLAELGLVLPPVPQPVAAYVPAVRTGSLVWTSGQLPSVEGELPLTGLVGESQDPMSPLVSPEAAKGLARVAVLNALAAIAAELPDGIDSITRIVKLTGYVASVPQFVGQPAVIDGASEFLGEVFGEAGAHARAAVGVAVLPKNAPVEIDLVVEVR